MGNSDMAAKLSYGFMDNVCEDMECAERMNKRWGNLIHSCSVKRHHGATRGPNRLMFMAHNAADSRVIGDFVLAQEGVLFWRHLTTDYYVNGTIIQGEEAEPPAQNPNHNPAFGPSPPWIPDPKDRKKKDKKKTKKKKKKKKVQPVASSEEL